MVLTNAEQGWRGEEASRPVEQEKVRNIVDEVRIALILIFVSFTGECVRHSRNNCSHANFNPHRWQSKRRDSHLCPNWGMVRHVLAI